MLSEILAKYKWFGVDIIAARNEKAKCINVLKMGKSTFLF